jgi:flagellar biosynthesis/type III secretory pathway protein FliH
MNKLNLARTTSAARSSKVNPMRVILTGLAVGALSMSAFTGVAQAETVSLAPDTASSTSARLNAPLVPSASSEYQIGYREGHRDGYRDGMKDARRDCKKRGGKPHNRSIAPSDRDNGYADGYTEGYDNGFDHIKCRRR